MAPRQQLRRHADRIPPILRAPIEIRQLIYSYLLPSQPVSHPLVRATTVSNNRG